MAALRAIWQDMVDKRLWPVAVLLLLAAVAVPVVLGGGSSAPAPLPPAPKVAGLPAPVAVAPAPTNPNQQVADTVNGVAYQRAGHARDPFGSPKPTSAATSSVAASAVTVATATKATAAAVTAASRAVTRSASVSAPATKPPSAPPISAPPASRPPPPAPAKPAPRVGYAVSILFGPPAAPARFKGLHRLTALPSASSALLSYVGVRRDGRTVTFALLQGALLSGPAACLPSPTQCQLLELRVGQQPELLGFATANGTVQAFELQVISVKRKGAAAARVSSAGRAVLRREDPAALRNIDYSVRKGVLVLRHHAHGHGLSRALLGLF